MEKVYIPQLLQQPDQTLRVDIDVPFPEIKTLTPVRGEVTITHQGTYLAVQAVAETIVTLTCHRCLQNYNHRVSLSPQELIWLEATPNPAALPLEREVGVDELVETLPPNGHFYPEAWLYEQVCLALPQRQICDDGCPGIALQQDSDATSPGAPVDSRWSALQQLQQQLKSSDA